jgi:hypothetical protein
MPVATTTFATTFPPMGCTRCRSTQGVGSLRPAFEGWSISETAILHSGLPFTVLSQPYIANGNGVFQANGASTVQFNAPAYANRVPGAPVYQKNSVAGVTVAGTKQWLNPDAFISSGRSDDGGMRGRRFAGKLPVRQLRTQLCPRTALHKLRHLHHQNFSHQRRHHIPSRRANV